MQVPCGWTGRKRLRGGGSGGSGGGGKNVQPLLKQGNTLLNVARLNAVESLGCVAMGRFFGGMCLNGVDGFFGRFEIVFGGKTTQSGSLKEVPVHFVLMCVCMFDKILCAYNWLCLLCCWSNGQGVVVAMTRFFSRNKQGGKLEIVPPGRCNLNL